MNSKNIALTILIIVLAGAGGYMTYSAIQKDAQLQGLKANFDLAQNDLKNLQQELSQSQEQSADLAQRLQEKEEEVEDLEQEISKAEKNVTLLTKLTTIDPELLKKYSQVYFLNEHYRPSELKNIDIKFLYPREDDEFIHRSVYPHLDELLEEAEDDGINLRVISAFRNFDVQKELKTSYDKIFGVGTANTFSAPQGYSEHQLGTTVDFTTKELGDNFTNIHTTKAYTWLKKNAYKYGFILSYPENNQYYQFEPWHWRFVGRELAKYLHDEDLNFYDVDQRKLDSYRLDIFEK